MNLWSTWHTVKKIMLGFCCLFVWGCSENGSNAQSAPGVSPTVLVSTDVPLPTELKEGETKFNTFCARCHGMQGRGTNNGPPLVHKIYEPNHHADMAFQRAAAQGVRAHHWKFGNMPKIDGVVPEDVSHIIGYVRWLQRQAGIF